MDQYIRIEQILWLFLKHRHGSCPHLKCCLIPPKIKCLFSVWPLKTRNSDFPAQPGDFFSLKHLLFLYLSQRRAPHRVHLAAHQGSLCSTGLWCDGTKAARLKNIFVAPGGTRHFSEIKLISGIYFPAFVWKWALHCCNYPSQPGKGK